MTALRFDYRDLFRSPRLAFSFQRLWIQSVGLFIGYAAYVILTYLAFLIGGETLGSVWLRYGLLPCAIGMQLPWYSWIVFGLGVVILAIAWLVTATAVSRAVYMNLKGNTFYTWKEAFRFALKKKAGAVVATPIAIFAIIVFIALGGVIIGLLGRIPYVGELGISLFSLIWYATSFFLIFVGLALLVSLVITPSVLATTDDDAFEGIFQSFSILAGQPWRFIVYEALVKILSIAGLIVFAFFAKKAWSVMTTILIWGMGDKCANLSFAATNLVQSAILPAVEWTKYGVGDFSRLLLFSHDVMAVELPIVMTISAVILAVFVLLAGLFVISYPFAIFNAGNTLLFLILKKKKDDENLLERKDKEEETEEEAAEKAEKMEELPSPATAKRTVKKAVAARKAPPSRKSAAKKPAARKRPAPKRSRRSRR